MQNPQPGFFTTNTVDVPALPYFTRPPPYNPMELTRLDTYTAETDNQVNKNDRVFVVTMSYKNIDWVHDSLLEQIYRETKVRLSQQNKQELARIMYRNYMNYYLQNYYLGDSLMSIVGKLNTLTLIQAVKVIIQSVKQTAWYLRYENADYNPVPEIEKPILTTMKGENPLFRKDI